ncbi:hypothetical protein BLOT_003230 [Blomia tropicalis]|nr:hypothetical protein BLOT_003230 [Blomia tropicalis]
MMMMHEVIEMSVSRKDENGPLSCKGTLLTYFSKCLPCAAIGHSFVVHPSEPYDDYDEAEEENEKEEDECKVSITLYDYLLVPQ